MSTRQQIIVNALRQRYDEVRKTASQLASGALGAPWTQVGCIEATLPDEPGFLDELQAAARDPQRRFELLTTRYRHPLNIAGPSEERVREHLLERLMVADRSRIEQGSLELLHTDDLLFRLNLIAIYASLTTDLRYLDALNYYYELLPSTWFPESFLSLYLRALATHSS